MTSLFEKGLKFNNSKPGIVLLLILNIGLFAVPINLLLKITDRKNIFLMLLSVFCIIIYTVGIMTAILRAKRLREK
jgi:hypothetical protein